MELKARMVAVLAEYRAARKFNRENNTCFYAIAESDYAARQAFETAMDKIRAEIK